MKHLLKKIMFIAIGISTILSGKSQEGADLYKQYCAPCHTIGKGRLVGPDLKNITEKRSADWLQAFIISSTTLINSGDADAIAIFNEYNKILMPDQPLDNNQVNSILSYMDQAGNSSADAGQETAVVPDKLAGTTNENVLNGLKLFTGEVMFEGGGSSCTSCHSVRDNRIPASGTLAKELSESYEIMGTAGIMAILKSPPFPAMTIAYKNHALTESEVIDLTAYLRSVSDKRIYQYPIDSGISLLTLGMLVFIMILIFMKLLFINRKKKCVNEEIYNRQTTNIN